MKASSLPLLAAVLLAVCCGCLLVPKTQWNECQAQSRALMDQNRAQLAEIENLRTHSRNAQDRLVRTEEQLAGVHEQLGLDRAELANYQREREVLHDQVRGLLGGGPRAKIPAEVSRQLVELSYRYPHLQFDPETGISKLDTDVMFDSGQAELKPAAEQMLSELVRVLRSPEASGLKVMVVGHTDDRAVAKKPARELYPNNLHLSTSRALAVADRMRQAGLPEQRLGVAGLGAHQPLAPNATAKDRQINRRVEIFVMVPEAPVVGWTDSMPGTY